MKNYEPLLPVKYTTNVMGVKWITPVKNNMNCVYSKNRQEHTDVFKEKAMMELNPYKIVEKWYPELIQMKLDESDYVEAYRL